MQIFCRLRFLISCGKLECGSGGSLGSHSGWVCGWVQWVELVQLVVGWVLQWVQLVDGWGPKWSPRLWSLLSSALLGAASTRSVISHHAQISGSYCQNHTYIYALHLIPPKTKTDFNLLHEKKTWFPPKNPSPISCQLSGNDVPPDFEKRCKTLPCLAGSGMRG